MFVTELKEEKIALYNTELKNAYGCVAGTGGLARFEIIDDIIPKRSRIIMNYRDECNRVRQKDIIEDITFEQLDDCVEVINMLYGDEKV